MAKNHYVTKTKRRSISNTRAKESAKRIAGTMVELRRREKLENEIEALAKKSDDQIDLSDIPEITDWSGAVVGKFYRGNK